MNRNLVGSILGRSFKNYLWRPCLLTDPDEMSNLYRGPAIDANFQVALHLTEGFQRRRLKCEKLTDFRFVWFSMLSEFLYWFSFIFMFVIVLIIMADRSFLAHLAKGNVSICHHLASVVR
jgi:hypothetical protein